MPDASPHLALVHDAPAEATSSRCPSCDSVPACSPWCCSIVLPQVEIRKSTQPAAQPAPRSFARHGNTQLPEDASGLSNASDPAAVVSAASQPAASAPAGAVTSAPQAVSAASAATPWVQMVNVWGAAWEARGLTDGPFDVRVTSAVGETVEIR
jgi:hypothetical protein